MPESEPIEKRNFDSKELFRDPNIVTAVFRRHGAQHYGPPMNGFLKTEGYVGAAEKAVGLVALIPDSATVGLHSSPSMMPARDRGPIQDARVIDPEKAHKVLLPQRALFSLRPYAKELAKRGLLFEMPTVSVSPSGMPSIRGVTMDSRLGDMLEGEDNVPFIPDVFKALADPETGYGGGMTPAFWADYLRQTIKPAVRETLEKAQYRDTLQAADHVVEVLLDEREVGRYMGGKRVEINTTHSDVEESFVHHAIGLAEQSGKVDPAFKERVAKRFNPNEGFDVHMAKNSDQATIVLDNGAGLVIDLVEYQRFLSH